MASFKDKSSRSWSIDLTIGTVERVKRDSGGRFNLYEPTAPAKPENGTPAGPALQEAIWQDYSLFWELLWFLVEPQAKAASVDAAAFGEAMAAECLIDAQRTFWEAWVSFFRNLGRSEIALVLRKLDRYKAVATECLLAKLNDPRMAEVDKEAETAIKAQIDRDVTTGLNAGLGKLRALSAATPEGLPSGNFGGCGPVESPTIGTSPV